MNSISKFIDGGRSAPVKHCLVEDPMFQYDSKPAIAGLHSNWIVPGKIVLSGRPSDRRISIHGTVEAMKLANVRAIVNLQEPFEHAHCGDGLLEHGHSYTFEKFEKAGIKVHVMGWRDMRVPLASEMATIVNTIDAVVKGGGAVLLHCHAGLGRSGTVAACYLVKTGMLPDDAVRLVRQKRLHAVQNEAQETFVRRFGEYLHDLPTASSKHRAATLLLQNRAIAASGPLPPMPTIEHLHAEVDPADHSTPFLYALTAMVVGILLFSHTGKKADRPH